MLANLLPGIRDLRTPLATGYIWLLTFWLWIPTHFKNAAPSTGVPGDIARLAHYSGRLGIGIALSFTAYLVGILSGLFNAPLTRIGSLLSFYGSGRLRQDSARLGQDPNALALTPDIKFCDFGRVLPSGMWDPYSATLEVLNARYSPLGLANLAEAARRTRPLLEDVPKEIHDAEVEYLRFLVQEVYSMGNVLLDGKAELFSAYDRLKAEYEFRIGITAPLVALVVTLAWRWTPLWLLAMLPLLLVLKSGSERRMDAGDLLTDAVLRRRISVILPPDLAAKLAPLPEAGDKEALYHPGDGDLLDDES
jgi:hypothetical protein